MSVIVTGDAGFIGSHVFLALKKPGDAVTLPMLALLAKLLEIVAFTHVIRLAAQAGVCYAMENPASNDHSNVAALVNLLATCKSTNPQAVKVGQPAASGHMALSSSVYGLNDKVPFSEDDHTDQPASLYSATQKKKSRQGDHPHIQPHLRPLHHRPPLLHRL